MGLEVGVNSYLDVAAANAYFADRYGAEDWDGLGDTDKAKVLISAAMALDGGYNWAGYPTDPDQPLAFPRDAETDVPQKIKNAQAEMALAIVAAGSPTAAPEGVELSALEAGSVKLTYNTDRATRPQTGLKNDIINGLVKEWTTGTGSTKSIPMERA